MEQNEGFQSFDNEQRCLRIARLRQVHQLRRIPIEETETWLFGVDLDEAIDCLAAGLEVSCH